MMRSPGVEDSATGHPNMSYMILHVDFPCAASGNQRFNGCCAANATM